jgi:DDE superfamily endonuclease
MAPGPQQQRFAAYIESLAEAAEHADRHAPLKNYCTGLLLPGERKSVEPMAARLAGDLPCPPRIEMSQLPTAGLHYGVARQIHESPLCGQVQSTASRKVPYPTTHIEK